MAKEELIKTQTALAPTSTAMARPDYIATSHKGVETITKADMLVPRIGLAQALSAEVTEGDPRMIEGLKAGDLFNSMSRESYGREVLIQIVRKDNLRAMEWRPIADGGGMIDPDVPLNDPRCKWGAAGEKPVATVYRDYLAVLLPADKPIEDRLIALSFKSSGITAAKQLNGLIALRNADIFAGIYKITTDTKLTPKPHKIYKVQNAGWVSKEDYTIGQQLYEAVKDLDVVIDREAGREPGDDDFVPADLERQPATEM